MYLVVSKASFHLDVLLITRRNSFVRSRHSYSRLSICRQLFDFLLQRYEVFPKIKEFVLSFGAKNGENEIGPPKLKFSPIIRKGQRGYEAFGRTLGTWLLLKLTDIQKNVYTG